MQVNYSYSLCNSRSFKTLNSIQNVKLVIIHHLIALTLVCFSNVIVYPTSFYKSSTDKITKAFTPHVNLFSCRLQGIEVIKRG